MEFGVGCRNAHFVKVVNLIEVCDLSVNLCLVAKKIVSALVFVVFVLKMEKMLVFKMPTC